MGFNIVVQNIEQYANLAAFPATGESNILYIDEALSAAYFWNGAAYSSVSGGSGGSVDRADLIGLNQITDGIITPPQLNSDQDDYSPTGFSTCNLIRQDINGDRVITGFVAPAAGVNRIFCNSNLSGSSNIKFKNNDSSSAAANRLLLRDNGPDKSIKENENAIFWYDHTSNRWRPYSRIG